MDPRRCICEFEDTKEHSEKVWTKKIWKLVLRGKNLYTYTRSDRWKIEDIYIVILCFFSCLMFICICDFCRCICDPIRRIKTELRSNSLSLKAYF